MGSHLCIPSNECHPEGQSLGGAESSGVSLSRAASSLRGETSMSLLKRGIHQKRLEGEIQDWKSSGHSFRRWLYRNWDLQIADTPGGARQGYISDRT